MSQGNSEGVDHEHASSGFQCENRDSCSKAICDKDRRRILGALAAGGSLSLAGCTGLYASPQSTGGSTTRDREFDVEYTQEEETLRVGEGQTVLGAGLDAGLDLSYDCKAGFCGTCLSKANGDANELVQMRINDVELLTEEAVEDGYFLPCTSNPDTHLKVDTSASTADLLEYQEEEEDEGEGEGEGSGGEGEGSDGESEDGSGGGQTFHQVTYTNEQWSIAVPEDKSLLVAGEDVGLELPFQCRVGRCGQCLARTDGDASEVVEMEANNYGPLDDEAISNGYFLTCVGFPRDDFELESNQYGEI
jgi:ferredoxin